MKKGSDAGVLGDGVDAGELRQQLLPPPYQPAPRVNALLPVVWCGVMWWLCGVVWCGVVVVVVWCSVVWCNVVW